MASGSCLNEAASQTSLTRLRLGAKRITMAFASVVGGGFDGIMPWASVTQIDKVRKKYV